MGRGTPSKISTSELMMTFDPETSIARKMATGANERAGSGRGPNPAVETRERGSRRPKRSGSLRLVGRPIRVTRWRLAGHGSIGWPISGPLKSPGCGARLWSAAVELAGGVRIPGRRAGGQSTLPGCRGRVPAGPHLPRARSARPSGPGTSATARGDGLCCPEFLSVESARMITWRRGTRHRRWNHLTGD